jgi:hypothetical protein
VANLRSEPILANERLPDQKRGVGRVRDNQSAYARRSKSRAFGSTVTTTAALTMRRDPVVANLRSLASRAACPAFVLARAFAATPPGAVSNGRRLKRKSAPRLRSLSYGAIQLAPPTNPPPMVGKAAVALPVGVPPLSPLTKLTTGLVSPAVPPSPRSLMVVLKRWRSLTSMDPFAPGTR